MIFHAGISFACKSFNPYSKFKNNGTISVFLNLNFPLLAAGIGMLAFCTGSDNISLYKIVSRFYFETRKDQIMSISVITLALIDNGGSRARSRRCCGARGRCEGFRGSGFRVMCRGEETRRSIRNSSAASS